MIFQFLKAQKQFPKKNDWLSQVMSDLKELDIKMSEQEIEEMSNTKFKTLCKTKLKDLAFKYLQEKKEKTSRSKRYK